MTMTESEPVELLARAEAGDNEAWGEALETHRERLERMLQFRMDVRLKSRVDVQDVLQETLLEATKRRDYFFCENEMPFYLWLRFLALQKVAQLYRKHIAAESRTPRREVSIFDSMPQATSAVLADFLLGKQTSPSMAVAREEMRAQVQDALDSLEPIDREVIALRNFEQLSNAEAAAILDIESSAASSRYFRALKRLKEVMHEVPGL